MIINLLETATKFLEYPDVKWYWLYWFNHINSH
jgi:hypothetical protein